MVQYYKDGVAGGEDFHCIEITSNSGGDTGVVSGWGSGLRIRWVDLCGLEWQIVGGKVRRQGCTQWKWWSHNPGPTLIPAKSYNSYAPRHLSKLRCAKIKVQFQFQ